MGINVIEAITAVKGYFVGLHFRYKSKKHGPGYLNMDPLFPYVRKMRQICVEMVRPFHGEFDAVVGAATGGIPLAYIVAVLFDIEIACWADKDGDEFVWERQGFAECLKGRKVLIVEDIANQGKTLRAIIKLVREAGGEVVGVACAVNRGGLGPESLGIPEGTFVALSEIHMDAYEPENCPDCRKLVPMITDLGHGDEFEEENPGYQGGFVKILDT